MSEWPQDAEHHHSQRTTDTSVNSKPLAGSVHLQSDGVDALKRLVMSSLAIDNPTAGWQDAGSSRVNGRRRPLATSTGTPAILQKDTQEMFLSHLRDARPGDRGKVVMQTGCEFPSSDRWERYLMRESDATEPVVPILVLEEDSYDEWLAAQTDEQQAWMAASGLSKFKNGGLTLAPTPQRWIFLTKNASNLYAFSALPSALPPNGVYRIEVLDGSQQPRSIPPTAALSWGLGSYSFEACKGSGAGKLDENPKFATLIIPTECDLASTSEALRGTYICRDLINMPTSDLGPPQLEAFVQSLAESSGATVKVVEGDALLKGYPQIHAVGRAAGGERGPRLIDMRWGSADAPQVTLVGKGVCFDTGGLDIKPPAGMVTMKKDMGGAAHVLGLASMIMDAKLPVNLRVLVPTVENSISGDAMRPGDVIVARNGKTTEVLNTDAEGRLILADALVEACGEQPRVLIDCATLTGAGRVALGTDVPALFCNDAGTAWADELMALSGLEQDQVWRLPLWNGYREQLDSKIADLKNIGAGPYGGAITAALYLNEFVEAPTADADVLQEETATGLEPPAWLHLDMMAYNTGSRPGRPEGGEAMGMRALFRLLVSRFGQA